jgi:hypothetical protein
VGAGEGPQPGYLRDTQCGGATSIGNAWAAGYFTTAATRQAMPSTAADSLQHASANR